MASPPPLTAYRIMEKIGDRIQDLRGSGSSSIAVMKELDDLQNWIQQRVAKYGAAGDASPNQSYGRSPTVDGAREIEKEVTHVYAYNDSAAMNEHIAIMNANGYYTARADSSGMRAQFHKVEAFDVAESG